MILNVYIRNAADEVVADIDGTSTADVLAYFLHTRQYKLYVTEADVLEGSNIVKGSPSWETAVVGFEARCPITGVLEAQFVTEVH